MGCCPFPPAEDSQTHNERADNATDGVSEAMSPDERIADYTLALDLLTGVLAISTIGLWVVTYNGTRNQSRDMEGAIAAAQAAADAVVKANELNREMYVAANRPWIGVTDAKIKSVLFTGETLVRLLMDLSLKNYGDLPAEEVILCLKLFTFDEVQDAGDFTREGPHEVLVEKHTLFPGQTFIHHNFSVFSADAKKDLMPTSYAIIAGYLSYRFRLDPSQHHSPFFYEIRRKDGEFLVTVGTKRVKMTDMHLQRLPFRGTITSRLVAGE